MNKLKPKAEESKIKNGKQSNEKQTNKRKIRNQKVVPLKRLIKLISFQQAFLKTEGTSVQILWTFKEYYGQFYANKFNNIDDMDKFLEKYSSPNLSQDNTENISIYCREITFFIKTF